MNKPEQPYGIDLVALRGEVERQFDMTLAEKDPILASAVIYAIISDEFFKNVERRLKEFHDAYIFDGLGHEFAAHLQKTEDLIEKTNNELAAAITAFAGTMKVDPVLLVDAVVKKVSQEAGKLTLAPVVAEMRQLRASVVIAMAAGMIGSSALTALFFHLWR